MGMEVQSIDQQEPMMSGPIWTKDTLSQILSRRDPVYDLMDSLSGIIRDRDGNIIRQGDPLMNNYGIDSFARILKSVLNENVILSNLSELKILMITRYFGEAILFDLFCHYKEYAPTKEVEVEEQVGKKTVKVKRLVKIKDLDMSDLTTIATISISSVQASLFSAENALTLRSVSPKYEKHETTVSRLDDEKKLRFPSAFGGRG